MKAAIIGLLLLIGASPAAAMAQDTNEAALLAAAGRTGAALFRFDRAAWVASDAAVEALKGDLPRDGGYVMEGGPGDALTVTFFSGRGAARRAVFAAVVRGGKVASRDRLAAPRPLTAAQARLADARDAAIAEAVRRGWRSCSDRPFNPIVLPPESAAEPVRVYLLTPQTKNGSYPVGGHYRVDVDPQGGVAAARPFTKTCLEMTPPPAAQGKPQILAVSHLLDPVPTELHVFTSHAARLPVAVIMPGAKAGGGLWVVNGDNIRRVPND